MSLPSRSPDCQPVRHHRHAAGRAGALLGLHQLPAAAARGDGGDRWRPRFAGGDAHRRRQVALLPGAGAGRRRAGAGRVAAHLADEGPGGHAGRQRRARPPATTARCRPSRSRRSWPGCARAASACSTSRPSGWSARAPTCSSAARLGRRAGAASWPSTRRTASASGATTSGRSTGSSAGCATCFPASACTPSRPRRPARVRRDIVAQLGLRDPLELVGSFDRPEPALPRPRRAPR